MSNPPEYQRGIHELAGVFARLRVCAVIAQVTTVLVVTRWLALPVPERQLLFGTGVLALFAAAVMWRLRRNLPVSEVEVVAHLGFDMAVLGYLLYLTGGATNPFITLYIMPIVLAATALSVWYLGCVVVMAGIAYAVLMVDYVPLPMMHLHHSAFTLHVFGMGINFLISALLLAFFVHRLAVQSHERGLAIRRVREQALRNEGILAIATQAAGAAHELNTPLSTMRTLLGELRRDYSQNACLQADLEILGDQTERCRDILRELVAVGSAQLVGKPESISLQAFVQDCCDRFRLLRPDIELRATVAPDASSVGIRVLPALRHAVLALFNNAADASTQCNCNQVDCSATSEGDDFEIVIRDHGRGPEAALNAGAGIRFVSDKRDGLGLGLALANATAERLGGGVDIGGAIGGGSATRLRLPRMPRVSATT